MSDNAERKDDEAVDLEQESVGDIIDGFIHRILDIEDCARQFIQIARAQFNENAKRLRNEISESQQILDKEEDKDKRIIGVKNLRKCLREIDRHNNSSPAGTLEKSLFVSLFSAFDKYTGSLLSVIYREKPDLYKNINREISLAEALSFSSMEELRNAMLEKEIETIRRKSYVEQFSDIEKKFSIPLTKFEKWPEFIECAQRRNLFTHCDGVVSKQYLEVCDSVGYKFKERPEVGQKLEVGAKYFYQSCHIVAQVGVMLGQTLWRKIFPEKMKEIDLHLNNTIYSFLNIEQWKKSIELSKFALDLPKISSDQYERMYSVNYAIALKSIGNPSAAKNVLDKKDWSAASYEFRLAYHVLVNEYKIAKDLMIKIGKEGELINEMSYHEWPLFRDFRDQQEFFEGYEEVYGYRYSSKLSSIAGEIDTEISESDAEESIELQE